MFKKVSQQHKGYHLVFVCMYYSLWVATSQVNDLIAGNNGLVAKLVNSFSNMEKKFKEREKSLVPLPATRWARAPVLWWAYVMDECESE
jgi:hypothetical protein